jgi:hypothetical protein
MLPSRSEMGVEEIDPALCSRIAGLGIQTDSLPKIQTETVPRTTAKRFCFYGARAIMTPLAFQSWKDELLLRPADDRSVVALG